MVREEIELFEVLKVEFEQKNITKPTANKAQNIYNRYNEKKITGCMCTRIKRQIYGKLMLDWYEGQVG